MSFFHLRNHDEWLSLGFHFYYIISQYFSADDRIDFAEFTSIMTEAPSDPAGDLTEAFRVFDKNGDGFVSREEIRCILGQDMSIAEFEIEDTLQIADKNGDGKIDIQGITIQLTDNLVSHLLYTFGPWQILNVYTSLSLSWIKSR